MPEPIIYTTSREPSRRTRSFIKDIVNLAPWLIRINRGKMTFKELVETAISEGAGTLVIVGEKKANPSIMRIYDLKLPLKDGYPYHVYTVFIEGIALSREKNRQTHPLSPSDAVIYSRSPESEEERKIVLSLIKAFNAKPAISSKQGEILRINIKKRYYYFLVDFSLLPKKQPVGPVLKIGGVKTIGRYSGPGFTGDKD